MSVDAQNELIDEQLEAINSAVNSALEVIKIVK